MSEEHKKVPRLAEVFTKLLEIRMKNFLSESVENRSLNVLTCTRLYELIFNTIVEVMTAAYVNLTNESMNYLAQQYYDASAVNGNCELDPNIFSQRAKLENIETKEVALMALMMTQTPFAIPLIAEVKRRS